MMTQTAQAIQSGYDENGSPFVQLNRDEAVDLLFTLSHAVGEWTPQQGTPAEYEQASRLAGSVATLAAAIAESDRFPSLRQNGDSGPAPA